MTEFTSLDPQLVDEIVALCDTMLADMNRARKQAEKLAEAGEFGELESAKQLAAGYRRKARGTPESAFERMDQFIAALTDIRDAFASGGAAFLDEQFEWARRIASVSKR